MHILLIHQAFAALDDPGGTRHHELAHYLVSRGHQVTIIASPVSYLTGKRTTPLRWAEKQNDDLGVSIVRSWTLPAIHRSFVWRVFGFISFMFSSFINGLFVRKVDLVWGTSPPIFQGLTAWLLARLKGVPFLFEVRDLWPAFAIAVGVLKSKFLIRLSEWLEGFLYRHADHVVVNSPGFIEHVTQHGAEDISLIPNGADPNMFDPGANGKTFREQHHLADKFVILYAGAHGMSNDLGVVLDAAEKLLEEANLRFVLLGDGKEKPALMAAAKARSLTNLLFLPPLPKNEMAEALAGADVCLAILKPIELYKTTYPNKVFDYMAAGKPVLLAIDGVIRSLVESAQAGIFVPPGDPQKLAETARSLMADPDKCKRMGLAGRNYIEQNYSRSLIADQFNDLLISLRRKNG
ncbi:MAG: glycosyltransferase family 4 protein [Anaerolineaceae bacterium]|nr:glycosyltransferase family 4 protein [Anaerolineaceae bacterium]